MHPVLALVRYCACRVFTGSDVIIYHERHSPGVTPSLHLQVPCPVDSITLLIIIVLKAEKWRKYMLNEHMIFISDTQCRTTDVIIRWM